MTQQVPLTRGRVALVDDEDYSRIVGMGAWQPLRRPNGKYYAYLKLGRAGTPGRRTLYMHRVIANTPAGLHTDHINGDSLDNRRANLRHASSAQNAANADWGRTKPGRFMGVRKLAHGWAAYMRPAGRLGHFATAEEAARAYDRAALAKSGEFARTNFPRHDYTHEGDPE